jgi:hypothetical protein
VNGLNHSRLSALLLTVALMAPWTALADAKQTGSALGVGGSRPWARAVAVKDQQAAEALFQEGNERLKESIFVEAVRHYRRALQHWNHPAIHYNLALALMNLDQPIEVHKHLVAAMHHGPEPLEASRFEHALSYKTLIEQQLAWVEISCDVPGTTVAMNGQRLFVAPGRYQGLVRPGVHSLTALKEGYVPTEQSRTLMPGEKARLDLKVYSEAEVTRYRRRWSAWVPWSVMGAGLAIAGGGGLLHREGRTRLQAFDAGITTCGGCRPGSELSALRSQGETLQRVAIGAFAAGGAALTTGVVLLYLNRSQPYRIVPEEGGPSLAVTPLVGAGMGGALGTFRF